MGNVVGAQVVQVRGAFRWKKYHNVYAAWEIFEKWSVKCLGNGHFWVGNRPLWVGNFWEMLLGNRWPSSVNETSDPLVRVCCWIHSRRNQVTLRFVPAKNHSSATFEKDNKVASYSATSSPSHGLDEFLWYPSFSMMSERVIHLW